MLEFYSRSGLMWTYHVGSTLQVFLVQVPGEAGVISTCKTDFEGIHGGNRFSDVVGVGQPAELEEEKVVNAFHSETEDGHALILRIIGFVVVGSYGVLFAVSTPSFKTPFSFFVAFILQLNQVQEKNTSKKSPCLHIAPAQLSATRVCCVLW